MKKIALVLAAVAMVFTAASCSKKQGASSASAKLRVAMVTDSGDITDQSFNQTTYEAGKAGL